MAWAAISELLLCRLSNPISGYEEEAAVVKVIYVSRFFPPRHSEINCPRLYKTHYVGERKEGGEFFSNGPPISLSFASSFMMKRFSLSAPREKEREEKT